MCSAADDATHMDEFGVERTDSHSSGGDGQDANYDTDNVVEPQTRTAEGGDTDDATVNTAVGRRGDDNDGGQGVEQTSSDTSGADGSTGSGVAPHESDRSAEQTTGQTTAKDLDARCAVLTCQDLLAYFKRLALPAQQQHELLSQLSSDTDANKRDTITGAAADSANDAKSADDENADKATTASVRKGPPTIGMVGYPNVGKSSTINALCTEKKVPVSSTPGRTRHFQTILLGDLTLCDCE